MDEAEGLTVLVPEPMAAQIRAAVEAGAYATASEAVQDAVRLWSGQRETERLRRAWDAGKAGGVHGPLDLDVLRREARRRLAATVGGPGHGG